LSSALQARSERPLIGLATSVERIQKNPRQVHRMVRGFLRATRALKSEKAGFIAFAQKKYGYSKDLLEEAYKYLVDALSQHGFVDDRGATSRHRRSQNARQNHQTHQSVGSRRLQLLARRGEKMSLEFCIAS
jgi:hypothetical protein